TTTKPGAEQSRATAGQSECPAVVTTMRVCSLHPAEDVAHQAGDHTDDDRHGRSADHERRNHIAAPVAARGLVEFVRGEFTHVPRLIAHRNISHGILLFCSDRQATIAWHPSVMRECRTVGIHAPLVTRGERQPVATTICLISPGAVTPLSKTAGKSGTPDRA